MSTALQILEKLSSVDILLSAQIAIERTADTMAERQREQLAQGLKSDESYLPDYSFRSVFQYGKPPGPIKLYDQGGFYRGISIDVRGDIFTIESADEKNTMLQNRYGKDILGLGMRARIAYIRTLQPAFINEVKSYLA